MSLRIDNWYGGRWVPDVPRTTLRALVADNAHDVDWIKEHVPSILKLRVGESYVYHGGAGGDARFTRLPERRRRSRSRR